MVASAIREWVFLRGAERTALGYSPEGRERIQRHTRAADRRRTIARSIRTPNLLAVAAELARQAVAHRLVAFAASRGQTLDASSIEAMERMLDEARAACDLPEDLVRSTRYAIELGGDLLGLDRLERDALDEMVHALLDVDIALRDRIEARTLTRIRTERSARVAGLGAALAYGVLVAWHAAFDPPNIAFHKRVLTSGGATSATAAKLVDGVRDSDTPDVTVLGESSDSWVAIDLGGAYTIDRVVVYNRLDRQFDASLPLFLEISTDGTKWTIVEQRRLHFMKWSTSLGDQHATQVRIRSKLRVPLSLNEIEVFGRFAR